MNRPTFVAAVAASVTLSAGGAFADSTIPMASTSTIVISRIITGPMQLNGDKVTRISAIWAGSRAACPAMSVGNGGGYDPPTVANLNIGGTLHGQTVSGGKDFPVLNGVVDLVVTVPPGASAFIVPITPACSPLFVSAVESAG